MLECAIIFCEIFFGFVQEKSHQATKIIDKRESMRLKGCIRGVIYATFRKFESEIGREITPPSVTGVQPKAGTGHKMQTISFFQRYIVRDISLANWAPVSST